MRSLLISLISLSALCAYAGDNSTEVRIKEAQRLFISIK